jgi:nucleotide-binding universal stress UspA family protein
LDLSTNGMDAIDVATSLAKADGGRITFFHTAIPDLPTESGYAAIELAEALRAAQTELGRVRPTDPSVPFAHEIRQGEPAAEIVKFAKENNVDMIVMTTHGRSGISRLLMGSVAEHVIRKAPCPVLTLRTAIHRDGTGEERPAAGGQD